MKTICGLCFHNCALEDGQTGACKARIARGGRVECLNYGRLTSVALDPIEKKPLRRFHPGSMVLSLGSFGCNLRCPFCQNSEISQAGEKDVRTIFAPPQVVADKAVELIPHGNIGVAYTYNEPLVSLEYVRDCAQLVHQRGLYNVVVTNGTLNEEPLSGLLPLIDAMNVDLKGFTQKYYDWLGGSLEAVKRFIQISVPVCHVEVTTLVVPGANDSEAEMDAEASWLGNLNPELPLHISRFFPRWKVYDRGPTPIETIYHLADVARRHLKYVYEGNC